MDKKVILMILDGRGKGDGGKGDAVSHARTPVIDSLYQTAAHTELYTFGEYVGLPDGQMGNSEVGHLNIGAGRVVYQDFAKINKAIRDGEFFENSVLLDAFAHAKTHHKKVHLLGLIGDGGVHAHQEHLYALCRMAQQQDVKDVFIHAFTDGRDTAPRSAYEYMSQLQTFLTSSVGKVASVIGRYYSMDRDNRRERVKRTYDMLVHGTGKQFFDPLKAIEASYEQDISDEFIEPCIITNEAGAPLASIEKDDVVVFFNYRTDRPRELTSVLTQKTIDEHNMQPLSLYFVTMTKYDENFTGVHIAYDKDNLINTLGEVVAHAGKTQLRIAETEKYPHVTFFFSGGREEVYVGETRIVIPSPKVATYDLQPEMSAYEVRDAVITEMQTHKPDFIALNFANPDMVGHTGVFSAVVKAVETIDTCVGEVVDIAKNHGYTVIIIADHGNADVMINTDDSVHTAHTTNMVPCIIIDAEVTRLIAGGKLGDIAPTVLHLMGVPQPAEMTGNTLIALS